MKKVLPATILICVVLLGCVQTKTDTKSESAALGPIISLSAEQLAEFNDDFNTFREDLWEKSYHLFREDAKSRYAAADVEIQAGQLVVTTKKGALSSATLGSNFLLVGDFDIQIDISIDFDLSIPMRQNAHFSLWHKGNNATIIFERLSRKKVVMKMRRDKVSVGHIQGSTVKQKSFSEFTGSVRAVRRGKKITYFYRNKMDVDWKKLYKTRFTAGDAGVSLGLKNFYIGSSSNPSVTGVCSVRYDNFKINAAEKIIETDEI
ncbi:MAG: hypothetical protein HKO79_04750 [Desulfobacterales bacterium]|nr:hypothetical protein [Desulfobacterales bacterium]